MDEPGPALEVTTRTSLRRKRERGHHDRAVIHAILDEGLVCHVGFSAEGTTTVLPFAYGRLGDTLYLHGAAANHMLRVLADGGAASITVTLVDGIVLARSAFHHSMNYRSVVLFGTAHRVEDPDEKRRALDAIVDHVTPGRSADARPPTTNEMRSTTVIGFPIEEGSAKIRTGGPIDDDEDLDLAIWAGQIPLVLAPGRPVPDEGLASSVSVPDYVAGYRRPGSPPAAVPPGREPVAGPGG